MNEKYFLPWSAVFGAICGGYLFGLPGIVICSLAAVSTIPTLLSALCQKLHIKPDILIIENIAIAIIIFAGFLCSTIEFGLPGPRVIPLISIPLKYSEFDLNGHQASKWIYQCLILTFFCRINYRFFYWEKLSDKYFSKVVKRMYPKSALSDTHEKVNKLKVLFSFTFLIFSIFLMFPLMNFGYHNAVEMFFNHNFTEGRHGKTERFIYQHDLSIMLWMTLIVQLLSLFSFSVLDLIHVFFRKGGIYPAYLYIEESCHSNQSCGAHQPKGGDSADP